MTNIDYINAHNGGIQMYAGLDNIVGWGNTAESVAYVLNTKGIADTCYQSSSMDFASEEGFDSDDGASFLFKKALELV